MAATVIDDFDRRYQSHLKHLKLQGLQPKTIEAYSRAIRRMGEYFDRRIDDLTEVQLTDCFSDLIETHSWSTVKLDPLAGELRDLQRVGAIARDRRAPLLWRQCDQLGCLALAPPGAQRRRRACGTTLESASSGAGGASSTEKLPRAP